MQFTHFSYSIAAVMVIAVLSLLMHIVQRRHEAYRSVSHPKRRQHARHKGHRHAQQRHGNSGPSASLSLWRYVLVISMIGVFGSIRSAISETLVSMTLSTGVQSVVEQSVDRHETAPTPTLSTHPLVPMTGDAVTRVAA